MNCEFKLVCLFTLERLFWFFRCATGEAWPDIMLDATSGRDCDALAIDWNKTYDQVTGEEIASK